MAVASPAVVDRFDNDHLSVEAFEDASMLVRVADGERRWRFGSIALQEHGPIVEDVAWQRRQRTECETYPGRFRVRREGATLRAELLDQLGVVRGSLRYTIELEGPWLRLTLLEIDRALPSLAFPPAVGCDSLVIPTGIGQWLREPLSERLFLQQTGHLNMRWVGGLRDGAGWLAIFDEGFEDTGVSLTRLAASPVWLRSLGRWRPPYTIRYGFVQGGYVELARAYRRWAAQAGLFRSLRDKRDACPAVDALIGGRNLSIMQAMPICAQRFADRLEPVPPEWVGRDGQVEVHVSHDRAADVIAEARRRGMTRGLVTCRGWIRGGYDAAHPDVWPPEPALGPVERLRDNLAPGPDLVGVLHDNYQDIYPRAESFPHGVVRDATGQPMPGGIWAGGQCYILDSAASLEYARRNWRRLRSLAPRGMFIDTVTAQPFYQSHDPDRRQTRRDDRVAKQQLLRFYKDQGLVLGSEEAADFGLSFVDYLENRHTRAPGQSVPLWPLVFHDAAVHMRYTGTGPRRAEPAAVLEDLLWGYAVVWPVRDPADWAGEADAFARSLAVDRWHRRVALDAMLDHRFHADGHVEQTTFESGLSILVNFADQPVRVDGVDLPALGHRVVDAHGSVE